MTSDFKLQTLDIKFWYFSFVTFVKRVSSWRAGTYTLIMVHILIGHFSYKIVLLKLGLE